MFLIGIGNLVKKSVIQITWKVLDKQYAEKFFIHYMKRELTFVLCVYEATNLKVAEIDDVVNCIFKEIKVIYYVSLNEIPYY